LRLLEPEDVRFTMITGVFRAHCKSEAGVTVIDRKTDPVNPFNDIAVMVENMA
jgi:hypothetical protein